MSDDTNRPGRDPERDPADEEREGGQVSETARPGPAAGGAAATDKSTGTAPDEGTQPHASRIVVSHPEG